MTAIAYVTDEKMLEYHRLNGSHSMAFWRLSSKKFSDFGPGDLLFFLSKSNEARRKNEKGIVGYGVFVSDTIMSVSAIWNKYKKLTGYNSKDELCEMIHKNSKTNEIPDKLSCLLLEKVVFFQSPIYLSELGYDVSNKLESFTYLDRNDGSQTLKILNIAKEIGLDSWSAMQNDSLDDELFEQQIIKHQIETLFDNIESFNKVTNKECNRLFIEYGKNNSLWVDNRHSSFISFDKPLTLYYIYSSNLKIEKENYYKLLGMMICLKKQLQEVIKEDVIIHILSYNRLNVKQLEILDKENIKFDYIEKTN